MEWEILTKTNQILIIFITDYANITIGVFGLKITPY